MFVLDGSDGGGGGLGELFCRGDGGLDVDVGVDVEWFARRAGGIVSDG